MKTAAPAAADGTPDRARGGAPGRTMLDKIWDSHVVVAERAAPELLWIDLHLVHEVTSPQAFAGLTRRGLRVRRPDLTLATVDHAVPTTDRRLPIADPLAAHQVGELSRHCREQGVPLLGLESPDQGIVHVIGPELGLTQPGMTIVCGDSHTATHGAFGALAFGIGTTEVEQVLATQCLLQRLPHTMAVTLSGRLGPLVTAKDLVLALVTHLGVAGGAGSVIEYRGPAVRGFSMEERMTVCNMSIEAGARAGLMAPDDTTFGFLAGRRHAPRGAAFEAALARWRRLPSDEDARFDREVSFDASGLEPMITFGTTPGTAIPVGAPVPDPASLPAGAERASLEKALAYMGLPPGRPLAGRAVDTVFIGSCTNARLSDLEAAALVLRRRRVRPGVRALVVPGSQAVKRAAEAAGLDRVFREAGAEWREPGCSMCIGMNGDVLRPGELCVSTSNRNFEGRQGKGGRTILASPITAAAAAVTGTVTDPRSLL